MTLLCVFAVFGILMAFLQGALFGMNRQGELHKSLLALARQIHAENIELRKRLPGSPYRKDEGT